MTNPDGIDRFIVDWLADAGAQDTPRRVYDASFDAARHTRRARPLPDFITRWLPMSTNFAAAPPLPLARSRPIAHLRKTGILIALALLALALFGAALLSVGGSPSPAVTVGNGRIAFVYQNDIYTVAPDGSDRKLLVEGAGDTHGVAWSPDGTRLAYWSGSDSGAWTLRVVDADGSDPTVVASGDASIGDVTGSWFPAWSPDGTKLAFTARTVGGPQPACVGSSDVNPSFCSSRVFVAEVDADESTGPVQIGDPDMSARTATWSPDGTTIAFSSGDAQKGIGLYLMKADGTDVRRLGEASGTWWSFMQQAWSPDGKSIAANGGMVTHDIWVFASDGSAETMVYASDPPVDLGIPAYAPDGVLAWGPGAVQHGGTMLLEAGRVPRTLAGFGDPVWSPDGLSIVTTSTDAVGHLVIIDRDGRIEATIADVDDWVSWQRLPG